jgi:hypothetical protein
MMSEEVARRRFPRFVIHIPFLYTPDTPLSASIGAGWTRALSEGGATVELSERLRPLTPLRLRLKTDQGTIEAEAKVVWSGGRVTEGGGVVHGLAFTWMAPDQFQTLRDMFRPLPIMRHAGVRLPLALIGHVSAIVERFKEKPMSSDSIYRTGVADQMNHREDSPSALVSYVCCHGSFPRE